MTTFLPFSDPFLPLGDRRSLASGIVQLELAGEHAVYIRDRTLFAQRFDDDEVDLSGTPTAITSSVTVQPFVDAAVFGVSPGGTLAYLSGQTERRVQLAWVDRNGIQLETVGAPHLKNRPPYKLSGGEKRAVAIASVLSMSPNILVMDEPSSDLDPRSRRRLIKLLNSFEHTKVIATHDLDMAVDVCERTIVLSEGRVSADGPTLELMRDEALLDKSGLEKPLQMQNCPVCAERKNKQNGNSNIIRAPRRGLQSG